jgi:hypothetical protein
MSGMTPHGPQVDDSEDVYRAILYPEQWAAEQNRPSSAAFDDMVFSVDLKSRTTPRETASRFRMTLSLVEFNCGDARALGFDTRDERDEKFPENRAHAHVYCLLEKNQRKKQARKLAKACKVVELASPEC